MTTERNEALAGELKATAGSDVSTPVPKSHPMMKAWESYKITDEYANTRKWGLLAKKDAQNEADIDGSLWAAFVQGWHAATSHSQVPEIAVGAEGVNITASEVFAVLQECGIENCPKLLVELACNLEHQRNALIASSTAGSSDSERTQFKNGLEKAARLVEVEYAPDKISGQRLKQIASHIRALKSAAPSEGEKEEIGKLLAERDRLFNAAFKALQALNNAAFKALQALNGNRGFWNGPQHQAAAILREITEPNTDVAPATPSVPRANAEKDAGKA